MGQVTVIDQQSGFASGLNTVSDPAFLQPDQATRLDNLRLTRLGAALKRLGTQFVSTQPISTFDTPNSAYGGLYWPRQQTIYAIAASTASSVSHIYSTTYGSFPRTWTDVGALPQYRPVVFTDNTTPEVMYVAGDDTQPVYKLSPALETINVVGSPATGFANGPASNFSWFHTFASGTHLLFTVQVMLSSAHSTSVVIDPSGQNIPLTLVNRFTAPDGVEVVELWSCLNPPQTGVLSIRVVLSNTATSMGAVSTVWSGVDQSVSFEPLGATTASGLTGTQPSVAVNAVMGDVLLDMVRQNNATILTPAAGQTRLDAGNPWFGASYQTVTASTVVPMSWTGASANWAQQAMLIRQSVATPSLTISALSPATPRVKGLCVYNDRLWGWRGYAAPNSLYYSNLSSTAGSIAGDSLGDPANAGGEIVVRTFGLQEIVVCAPLNGSLVIWHQVGISNLTGWGQSDIEVQPQALSADIGMGNATPDGMCVANELTTGDQAYFVTTTGIYKTNGQSVVPLGSPAKPDPTSVLLATQVIQPSQFILTFNRQLNEVWVGIQGVGVYVYNVMLGAWSGPFTGSYTNGLRKFFQVVDGSGNAYVWKIAYTILGGATVAECDRASVFKDDVSAAGTGGSTVTSTLGLRRMFGDGAQNRVFSKSWRWINLLATLTANATPPVVTTQTPIGGTNTNTLSTPVGTEYAYYVSPGGMGPWIDTTITDAGTTGPSEYALATVQGNLLGQR